MKSNVYYVYALVDPLTDLPFYIGKGKNNRCFEHLRETEDSTENIYKFRKIRSIIESGHEVTVTRLHVDLDEDAAYAIEEALIEQLGRKVVREDGLLTNICPNGRPPNNKGVSKTDQARKNMSLAQKGRIFTPEHRNALSAARKGKPGRPHTEESIQKMSAAKKGRSFSDAHRNSLSEANKGKFGNKNNFYGKRHSESTLEKISKSLTGKVRNDEFKKNLSDLHSGKPKPKITCPHCGREGGTPQMKRYHFDNCKTKGN